MINGFFGKYRFLSNFYEYPIVINGITFRSAENAYQSFKTIDKQQRLLFTDCTPKYAKHLGRKVELRPDWESIKLDVMERIVRIKFTNTLHLRKQLILTGNRELVEKNTWNDLFWGRVGNSGENHLGKILMRIRDKLYL